MAKHKKKPDDDADDEKGDTDLHVEEQPAEQTEGVHQYPPPVPDQAGERTGNVPPAKQLPTPPPESENPGGGGVDAGKPAPAKAATRTARVTFGTQEPETVTFPADAKDATAAAVQAYQQKHGLWALPTQPHVELDPKG